MTGASERTYGALRTALIGYGIAAFAFLSTRSEPAQAGSAGIKYVLWGIGLQLALMAVRAVLKRRMGDEAAAKPLLVVELAGDGATVLLFVLGTFGTMFARLDNI